MASLFTIDETLASADLDQFTSAPHPLGSERQSVLSKWLKSRIGDIGTKAIGEAFVAVVPNPSALSATGPVARTLEKSGTNVWAVQTSKADAPCVVAIGSHYDSKTIDGIDYVGANDSGSSSIVLLQLMAFLRANGSKLNAECDVIGVWFDGEEAVLANWYDGERIHPAMIQDNTYGSRHAAGRLRPCDYDGKEYYCLPDELGRQPLVAVVLMDMIGSKNLRLTKDTLSTVKLVETAVAGATALGYPHVFGDASPVEDDHIPFVRLGIPAVDLIDFHNLATWHKDGDTKDTLDYTSMETAGRIALYTALVIARAPAAYPTTIK